MKPVALITGGAIRIGKALAEVCADNNYRLVIHYNQSQEPVEQFIEELEQKKVDYHVLQCDLSDENLTQQVFEQLPESFKPVQLLINSAAIFPENDEIENVNDNWDSVMNLNARAPLLLAQQMATQLEQYPSIKKDCQIVNVIDARLNRSGDEHFTYRMSKAVLKQATHDLALSLAPNIRVNAIAPGAILPPPGKSSDHLDRLSANIPLCKTGDLEHVKNALKYLLEQTFVTGEILTLDGGEFL